MHPEEFFKQVEFSQPQGWICSTLCTDDVRARMQKVHPSQLLRSTVKIPFWEIKFSYNTSRGNFKEHVKYMFTGFEGEESPMMVEMNFNDWLRKYNKENPHRTMENVQILSISPLANAIFSIG